MKIREKQEAQKIRQPMLLRQSAFGKSVKNQYILSVLVEHLGP